MPLEVGLGFGDDELRQPLVQVWLIQDGQLENHVVEGGAQVFHDL